MVGEEAPYELMRDEGEPPIYGGLRPNHRREIRATRNLTGKEKASKRCGRGRTRGRDRRKEIRITLEQNTE
jgi:hypothetical protein